MTPCLESGCCSIQSHSPASLISFICTKAPVSLLPFLIRLLVFLTIPIAFRSSLALIFAFTTPFATLGRHFGISSLSCSQELQALNLRPTRLHLSQGEDDSFSQTALFLSSYSSRAQFRELLLPAHLIICESATSSNQHFSFTPDPQQETTSSLACLHAPVPISTHPKHDLHCLPACSLTITPTLLATLATRSPLGSLYASPLPSRYTGPPDHLSACLAV